MLIRPGPHWAWISVVFYAVACVLPAIKAGPGKPMLGWECLLVFPVLWWWSNPLYLIGMIAYWRRWLKTAAVFGAVAVLIGVHLEFVLGYEELLPGAVLWVTCFQIFTVNAAWDFWVDRKMRMARFEELS